MAKEPESLVLRLLREIRSTQQQQHTSDLSHLKGRVDDLYKISTHTLGVAANAHLRYEALESRVERLTERVRRLEAKP